MKKLIIDAYQVAFTIIVVLIALFGLICPLAAGLIYSPWYLLLYLIEPLIAAFAVYLLKNLD
jgi:hypothetical protein